MKKSTVISRYRETCSVIVKSKVVINGKTSAWDHVNTQNTYDTKELNPYENAWESCLNILNIL